MPTLTIKSEKKVEYNPFRFLRAYTREEIDAFEGRSEEIGILYEKVRSNRISLVYGESGVGKTSLIQCGLANKFQPSDWYDVLILRKDDINKSLLDTLSALVPDVELPKPTAPLLLKELYVDNFKPVYLIFDQLEELYVNGTEAEIAAFYDTIDEIIHTLHTFCRVIFVIREDFHARLDGFEKQVVPLFQTGFRVNRLKESDAVRSVKKILEQNAAHLTLCPGLEPVSRLIAEKCTVDGLVNSSQLQILLFMLWRKAPQSAPGVADFSEALIRTVAKGSEELLKEYVSECLEEIAGVRGAEVLNILQNFVAADGTKRSVDLSRLDVPLTEEQLGWLAGLKERQLLKQLDDTHYELIHDSLIPILLPSQSKPVRPRLEKPLIRGNPYKGLSSYTEADEALFFGRSWVVAEFNGAIRKGKLLVIVGPSGSGKSSLIKAGLLPPLVKEDFHVVTCRPGQNPARLITQINAELEADATRKTVIYIDQFEELSTQSESEEESKKFIDYLNWLLSAGSNQEQSLKIVLSVRADYEYEFDKSFPTWRAAKRTIPPFSEADIREIIIEPGYYAGLEFKPAYLVDNIVRDVMQSNGTLPLLSYTLSQMYEEYEASGAGDGFLTEDYYNKIGGVTEGLPSRANAIYNAADPATQKTIRNVMLRMVSMGIGEKAAKRVYLKELQYEQPGENERVAAVLDLFCEKWLVVTGKDDRGHEYYEPTHDSLIRAWPLIDQWIKKFGKEILFLQQNLTEAVSEYKRFKKLWNEDPRLHELVYILNSPENWLNRDEARFVRKSETKRQKLIDRARRKQEADRQLLQDKKEALEKQVKSEMALRNYLAEKVDRKTRTANRFKFLVVASLALAALVFYLFIKSNKAYTESEKNAAIVKEQKTQLEVTAHAYLLQKNAAEDAAKLARYSGTIARAARDTAEKFAKKSRVQYLLAQEYLDAAKTAKSRLEIQTKELQEAVDKYKEADSQRKLADLRVQQAAQSAALIATLLQQAKSLRTTQPAAAYRLTLLLQKRDPTNIAIKQYLSSISIRTGYYESVITDSTKSATFSNQGDLFRTVCPGNLVRIWDLKGSLVGSYQENGTILSAVFSPNGRSILTAFENTVTLRTTDGHQIANMKSDRPVQQAFFSRISGYIVIIDAARITVLDPLGKAFRTIGGNFSELRDAVAEGDRLVVKTATRIISYNLYTGATKSSVSRPDGFLLPDGKGILVFNDGKLKILDNTGKENHHEVYQPKLDKAYTGIATVSFSGDCAVALIRFTADYRQQQQQQQQQQTQKGTVSSPAANPPQAYCLDRNRRVLSSVDDLNDDDYPDALLSDIGQDIVCSKGARIIVLRNFTSDQGSDLRIMGDYDGVINSLGFSPRTPNTVLATTTKGQIGKTVLWVYGTPQGLDSAGWLKHFSDDELTALTQPK